MIERGGTVHFMKKAWNLEDKVLSYELFWVGNHQRYTRRVKQK